jgi:hypothetical protein
MEPEDLPREIAPPPDLEERSVARLRREGLLRPATGRAPWWASAAAAVLLFAAGAWSGVMWANARTADVPRSPRFLLLLHGAASSPGEEARTAQAYGAWAARLRNQGRAITGERLGPQAVVVPPAPAPDAGALQGYFVVSAADLADAIAVAEASPHVARGGQVIVRPIDTP